MKAVEWQNFAINIFGPSKVGKTTALLASTSLFGIGVEQRLPNWNSTTAAAMEDARGYNDLLLPGNEAGLIDGKKRDAYSVIRSRIYSFAEGRDRSRMSKASITTPKDSATYRGIALYTAEYSFEEYAAFAGEVRSQGEYARAMDVPAVSEGRKTIFDRYPGGMPTARRPAWARNQVVALRRACARQCGTAIRPYVEHLMKLGDKLPALVRASVETFMQHVRTLGLDPALEHAAQNFGLLYAAACLGIEANVFPWNKAATLADVLKCFEQAVRAIKGHEETLDAAKRELRKRLSTEDIRPVTKGGAFGPADAVGFLRKENRGGVYTIHSKAFRIWFSNRTQCVSVLRWLFDEGLLDQGMSRAKPSATATEWAEHSPRWPDGTTQRSFVFRDPFATPLIRKSR